MCSIEMTELLYVALDFYALAVFWIVVGLVDLCKDFAKAMSMCYIGNLVICYIGNLAGYTGHLEILYRKFGSVM